jgi:hypothetical protein
MTTMWRCAFPRDWRDVRPPSLRPSAAPIPPSRRPFATPSPRTSLRSRASPSLQRRCRGARHSAPWGVRATRLPPHPPRLDRSSMRSLGGCSKPPGSPPPTRTPRCSSSRRMDAGTSDCV